MTMLRFHRFLHCNKNILKQNMHPCTCCIFPPKYRTLHSTIVGFEVPPGISSAGLERTSSKPGMIFIMSSFLELRFRYSEICTTAASIVNKNANPAK